MSPDLTKLTPKARLLVALGVIVKEIPTHDYSDWDYVLGEEDLVGWIDPREGEGVILCLHDLGEQHNEYPNPVRVHTLEEGLNWLASLAVEGPLVS